MFFSNWTVRTVGMVVVLGMATAGCAMNGGDTSTAATGEAGAQAVSMQDKRFVSQAIPMGVAEVELGKLAAERASDPAVREFGQQMAEHHGQANQRLISLAQRYQIDAPKALDPQDRQMRERLSRLSGPAFDAEYMKAQVKDHEKALSLYEQQAAQGKADPLQALAADVTPLLREHLQQARAIDSAVGRGAGGGAGSAE